MFTRNGVGEVESLESNIQSLVKKALKTEQPEVKKEQLTINSSSQTEDIPIKTNEIIQDLENRFVEKDEVLNDIKEAFDDIHLKNSDLKNDIKQF